MRSNRLALALAVAVAILPAIQCAAGGTSGSQFLGVGIGARAAAMGGAGVSISGDGTALFWNPAGLTQVTGHSFGVSHLEWLSDATYQHASYAAPFGDKGALGLAIEQGSLDWDNTGEGTFDAGDFGGVVGYGRRLRPNLGVGGSVKYLSSTLGDDSASSYALDLVDNDHALLCLFHRLLGRLFRRFLGRFFSSLFLRFGRLLGCLFNSLLYLLSCLASTCREE